MVADHRLLTTTFTRWKKKKEKKKKAENTDTETAPAPNAAVQFYRLRQARKQFQPRVTSVITGPDGNEWGDPGAGQGYALHSLYRFLGQVFSLDSPGQVALWRAGTQKRAYSITGARTWGKHW